MDYLTNDNAANHRALRAAAEEAVRDSRKTRRDFLARICPTYCPLRERLQQGPRTSAHFPG
jgi:hypothetical protein